MTNLVLTEEQTRLLAEARGPVAIVTTKGNTVAVVHRGFTDEEVREAEKRLLIKEPSYTTAEVLNHLRSLNG
jgi:hypothetical protein